MNMITHSGKRQKLLFLLLGLLFWHSGNAQPQAGLPHMSGYSVRLFQYSPAWKLARAVQFHQTWLIRRLLAANPALANYQEPRYSESLLYFAVFTHRYMAARALLKGGVNPNTAFCFKTGATPLIEAASFYGSSRFVRLLLAHGADSNLESSGELSTTTPLSEAAESRLESVQLLLAQGANINYVSPKYYRSALEAALLSRQIKIARYLIIEKQADFRVKMGVTINKDTLYIADELRNLPYALESEEHKVKMEVVHYIEERGIDYRGAPVPQRFYHMYSKEFIETY